MEVKWKKKFILLIGLMISFTCSLLVSSSAKDPIIGAASLPRLFILTLRRERTTVGYPRLNTPRKRSPQKSISNATCGASCSLFPVENSSTGDVMHKKKLQKREQRWIFENIVPTAFPADFNWYLERSLGTPLSDEQMMVASKIPRWWVWSNLLLAATGYPGNIHLH